MIASPTQMAAWLEIALAQRERQYNKLKEQYGDMPLLKEELINLQKEITELKSPTKKGA